MPDHRYLGVDATRRDGVAAICSCGWRSEHYPSAGLAGSAWDHHANEDGDGD